MMFKINQNKLKFSQKNKVFEEYNITMPKFHRAQEQCVFSSYRYTLYSGGLGAAKTATGVWRTLNLATMVPGIHFVGAFTMPMIKDFIVPEFIKWLSDRFPRRKWEYRKGDRVIDVFDSEIRLRQLEEEGKTRGPGYQSAWVDEFTVGVKEDTFNMLCGRLREGGRQFFTGTTNPGTKTHFAYRFWNDCSDEEKEDRLSVKSSIYDNVANLPKTYIADLETRGEDWKKRFMLGEWGSMEDSVYHEFERGTHSADFEMKSDWTYYLAVDFGYRAPFVCLLVGESGGRFYICKELYVTGQLPEDWARYINANFMKHRPKLMIADYGDAISLRSLEKLLRIPVKYPNKSVMPGIWRVKDYLKCDPDGIPGLIVHSSCSNFMREVESYEWEKSPDGKPIKEAPRKVDDHGLDAIRYLLYTLVYNLLNKYWWYGKGKIERL